MQIQQRKRVDIGADIFTVCIRTWIDEILNAIHLVHAQIVGIDEQIYFSSFGKVHQIQFSLAHIFFVRRGSQKRTAKPFAFSIFFQRKVDGNLLRILYVFEKFVFGKVGQHLDFFYRTCRHILGKCLVALLEEVITFYHHFADILIFELDFPVTFYSDAW